MVHVSCFKLRFLYCSDIIRTDSQRPKSSGRKVQHGAQGASERPKFVDLEHTLLPPRIPVWSEALINVDRSQPAPPHEEGFRYWVPEPAALVNVTQERAVRYITNWLRVRTAWFWVIERAQPDWRILSMKNWRDLLNYNATTAKDLQKTTRRASEQRVAFQYFAAVFGHDNILQEAANVEWFGEPVVDLGEQTIKEVMWEVCDVGFRVELRHLDRILVPPPVIMNDWESRRRFEVDRERIIEAVFDGRAFVSDTLPTSNAGLAAQDIRERAPSLDGLRRLVMRWPHVPQTIRDYPMLTETTPIDDLERAEREMSCYYCQTFFEHSGRAPILPRRFPL